MSYSKVSYHCSTQNFAINPMGMSIWPKTNPKYKYKYKYQMPKPKMLSCGHTTKCLSIFPIKISPEIQWVCPFAKIRANYQIPNTNTKYQNHAQCWSYNKVSYHFVHSKFHQKFNEPMSVPIPGPQGPIWAPKGPIMVPKRPIWGPNLKCSVLVPQ